MKKGESTRSGLLWEVERLLNELNKTNSLPQILLMENVPDVIGKKNIKDFAQWIAFLDSLGYNSYDKILNAKDFGVAQNRERCFMVSVLGDRYYDFPNGFKLEKSLEDYLVADEEVEEKYWLNQVQIESTLNSPYDKTRLSIINKTDISRTLCARDFKDPLKVNLTNCELIGTLEGGKWDTTNESCRRVYGKNGLCPTITAMGGGNQEPKIITEKVIGAMRGRDIENPKSKKYSTNMKQMLEIKDDGTANTLTTVQKDNLVVERLKLKEELIGTKSVRKLLPLECWRLMDFTDEDFYKAKELLNNTFYKGRDRSSSQQYRQAGNSIVVAVLENIFKEML